MTNQDTHLALHFLWLEVADLDRSTQFYGDILAFPIIERTEAFTLVDLGNTRLYLATGQPLPTNMYLAIAVPDVDALYQQLLEAGFKVSSPEDEGWARYLEYVDPDGYRLLFLTPQDE